MKPGNSSKAPAIAAGIAGAFVAVWLGIAVAPGATGGLVGMLGALNRAIADPLHFQFCAATLRCVLVCLFIYGLAVLIIVSEGMNFRRGEEYGSAKWGSPRSIDKKYRDRQHPDENLIMTQHVAIGSSQASMYRHRRNLNTVVIGGSGSGKSTSHVLINILQASHSYVVLDPSGEMLRATGNYLKAHGYTIHVLNLVEPERSDRYNPFCYLRSDDDVDRMVENFWKATAVQGAQKGEQIWDDMAKELLSALAYYLYYEAPQEEQNFPTIQFLLRNMGLVEGEQDSSPVEQLFSELEQRDPEHIALKHYRAYHSGATKTLQSIQITLLSRLGKFNLESIERLSTTNTDDLGLLTAPEERTVIFAVTPVADSSFNFFVSLLYGQLFEILYEYGNRHGKLKEPLHILMDEFANITLPKDFELRLATFRKYGISASIILQDMSQLKALYEKQWQAMMNNADELLYLGGNESGTHEYLSKLLGKQTIRTNTFGQSKGRSGSFSKNEQQLGRELLTPDEIRMLDNKLALLLIRGERPILDEKYDFQRHPHIKETTYGGAEPYIHNELTRITASFEPVYGLTKEQIEAMPEAKPVWFAFIDNEEQR